MSEKCKHGIRDIETNLPYCRRCDAEGRLSKDGSAPPDQQPTGSAARSIGIVRRLERHIAQMASHQKEREGGKLILDALAELKRLHKVCGSKECVMCQELVPYGQQFQSTDGTHPLCEGCWLEKGGKPINAAAL